MANILVAVLIFRMTWLFAVLIGTAYVVFWLGYSGWWWVLAIVLLAGGSSEISETKVEKK